MHTLENAHYFYEKLDAHRTLLGTCITFADPTVTEALTQVLDFVWIDTEHTSLTLMDVQAHIMATKGTKTIPLVRVPDNDPALIKPVLDIGAAGVIVPLVKSADDVRRAVAACRYPPQGIRGYGPRRPSGYGADGGPDYCLRANQSIIVIAQIEQVEALHDLSKILTVPGLNSLVVGPNDLAASLGHVAQPRHPEVVRAIDVVIEKAREAKMPVGIAVGDDPEILVEWADKGVNWISMSADFMLLLRAAGQLVRRVRERK